MSAQVESGPGHGQGEGHTRGSRTPAQGEGHEAETRSHRGVTRRKGTVSVPADQPTPLLTGPEPPLFDSHLGAGTADDRSQSRAGKARDQSGKKHDREGPCGPLALLPIKPEGTNHHQRNEADAIGETADPLGEQGPGGTMQKRPLGPEPFIGPQQQTQDRQSEGETEEQPRPHTSRLPSPGSSPGRLRC